MSIYFWLNFFVILGPLLLSFDKKVAFWRRWPPLLLSILIVSTFFIVWDIIVTLIGHWAFSEIFSGPIKILNLPLGEWLFFFAVPYATIFIYECVRAYFKEKNLKFSKYLIIIIGLFGILPSIFFIHKGYTVVVGIVFLATMLLIFFFMIEKFQSKWTIIALFLSYIPFLIFNGVFTYLPIVLYNNEAIIGLRLFSIPIEDFFIAFHLLVFIFSFIFYLGNIVLMRNNIMKKIAIIGAGLGGISASIYLKAKGWDVDIYETQSFPGGKAAEEYQNGYRFDTGPSLVTMPWVFEDVFKTAGKDINKEITLIKLEEICTYYLSDGTYLKAWSEIDKFGIELEKIYSGSHKSLLKYIKKGKKIYSLGGKFFLNEPIQEIRFLLKPSIIYKMIQFAGVHPFSTLNKINMKYFKDPRIVQLFNRYATYNGSNPYQTPATMILIPFIEYFGGGFAIKEGIFEIPKKLHKAAEDLGVNFNFNQKVEKIITQNKKVKGIQTSTLVKNYEIVISNADVLYTYEKLLRKPESKEAKRYKKLEPSSSGIVFYWGINRTFKELSVNNIIFSSNYIEEFNSMFKEKTMPKKPTVYINITSKVSPSDAPDNCENWFVLLNAPADYKQDWDSIVNDVREYTTNIISQRLGVNIKNHIETEKILTPPEIKKKTGSSYGSLYGISSNKKTSAFLRHRNRSKRIKGLYFCGGSAHPGGGMPLVLLSGKICAKLVEKKYSE